MTQSGEQGSLHLPAGGGETSGSKPRVFISFASQDAGLARNACSSLESAGFPCWMAPRDVVPGTLYADGIVRAINESTILVLILSKHAIESPHVGKELERAASKRHPIIALRIDDAPLTPAFEYFLGESQWIDVKGDGTDTALERLVGAVRRHLAPQSSIAASLPPEGRSGTHGQAFRRRRWIIAALVASLTLAVVYLWTARPWLHGGDKSIAVLPFTDMSEKKDQEYLADGLADEILDVLVKIPGLKVIGRTSSFQFKGQNADLRTIGSQLGARYVLEGSVRKSGDRFRVTAQLIDSHDGTHLMSQTYDRSSGDVIKMQDEIAASLVRTLQVEVGADPAAFHPVTHNSDAYTLYLRGRQAYERYDQAGFEQAESDLKRALELDPSMAGAASASALVYDTLGEFGFLAPAIAFEQARHTAQHALELDPKNVLAHWVLGSIHDVYDWDWDAADRELRQSIALSANNPIVMALLGRHLMIIGRPDDGLKMLNAALTEDPLNPALHLALNWLELRRGRAVEAESSARRVLEINPTYVAAHFYLGVTLLAVGRLEEALAEFQKETDEPSRLGGLAIVYHLLGRHQESDAALAQMQKSYAGNFAFGIAEAYAKRGDTEQALQWLDRAYIQKDSSLYFVKGDWPLRELEADSRFKAFLRKMNLPE